MRPYVYCDFNDRLAAVTYGLRVLGTRADLERQALHLEPGMRVTPYDFDAQDDGTPAWLLADALVVVLPGGDFAAEADLESFRWEPRETETAPGAG